MPRKARSKGKRAEGRRPVRSSGRPKKLSTIKDARKLARQRRREPSIREVERGVQVVGEARIKRGPIRAKTSNWRTPTKKGYTALEHELRGVTEIQERALARAKRKKRAPLFTFDLQVKYRGKDGKMHATEWRERIGVPRVQDLKRRKGETAHQAMRRAVRAKVNAEVRAEMNARFRRYEVEKKLPRERALAIMREIKEERRVSWRVRFNREV